MSVEPSSGPSRSATPARAEQQGDSRRPRVIAACGLALVAVVAAGCGSSGSSASPNAPAASPSSSAGGSGGNGPAFRRAFSGVAGKVVSINSSGAQVQTSTGTSTIAWASSTRFSKVATISLAALVKGDCVTVSSTGNGGAAASAITARTVSVTSTSGCARGVGRAGGGFGGGTGGGTPPSNGNFGSAAPFGSGGSPRPFPSGSRGPGRGGFGGGFRGGQGFGGTFGTVASVSGSSFTVTSLIGAKKVTVTTTPTTTYTATSTSTEAALVTGTCASALGSKTSNGTVDALSITISTPANGKCPAAPALRGPGGFGGFGGARPPSGTASPGADNA